jgi:hypothetical protein
LILILDEFDGLDSAAIARLGCDFSQYLSSSSESNGQTFRGKRLFIAQSRFNWSTCRLGVENVKGSPFNVQRSVHIPNLTHDEVVYLFDWYQRETGQSIQPEVVERIWYEFQGQPG